ncbi:MAG: tripartite tricarboxylate transporter permease [Tistlia sp.]|uniref:tripartite tricarboxylate transporter permease n=1 Tax=Tistlia sp. TaxID=3057121 RepID=UPI0034A56126
MMEILGAFALILEPYVLAVILGAGCLGILIGSIPGLTATMGAALLVPITFFMDPVPAIAAIVTLSAVAVVAGDIPGALLRMPGTPASAAYTLDAHTLVRQGRAELALGTSIVCASLGGLLGSVVLVLAAPTLARFALNFSDFEYFWLTCLGLTCAAFVSPGSTVKGAASLFIGLLIATVGLDVTSGFPRFTFGTTDLMGGVPLIPAMIGMFAIAEVFRHAVALAPVPHLEQQAVGGLFSGLGKALRPYRWNILRGGLIGTLIGALPGAGADIAAWVAYAVSRRFSRTPERFGTGHVEGICDAGAANNGSLSGAWVPALVFGIPGDTITAIAIGVLILKGMQPGPAVFINSPTLLYAVFISFFVANLLIVPLGWAAVKAAKHVVRVPRSLLMPLILGFCIVGAFAITNSLLGVQVMLALGLLGYLMEENGLPVAPAILGIVLGGVLEQNFMTSMLKAQGDLLAFFDRPVAAALGTVTLLVWASPLLLRGYRALAAGQGRKAE